MGNVQVLKQKIFDYMQKVRDSDPMYQLTHHIPKMINENSPYMQDFHRIEELLNTVFSQINELKELYKGSPVQESLERRLAEIDGLDFLIEQKGKAWELFNAEVQKLKPMKFES